VIYARRRHALLGERLREDIFDMLHDFAAKLVEKYYDDGNIAELKQELRSQLLVDVDFTAEQWQRIGKDGVREEIVKAATAFYRRKEERLGAAQMALLEKMVALQVIDSKWKDHLREMDDLKEGIHLRAYGQKDPLIEYKAEAYRMFVELIDMINTETLNLVFKLFPTPAQEFPLRQRPRAPRPEEMMLQHRSAIGMGFEANREPVSGVQAGRQSQQPQAKPQPVRVGEKIGRNDPCPCGSGKKYKHCHGR
jgi:preprotein translocase subunit SecA